MILFLFYLIALVRLGNRIILNVNLFRVEFLLRWFELSFVSLIRIGNLIMIHIVPYKGISDTWCLSYMGDECRDETRLHCRHLILDISFSPELLVRTFLFEGLISLLIDHWWLIACRLFLNLWLKPRYLSLIMIS